MFYLTDHTKRRLAELEAQLAAQKVLLARVNALEAALEIHASSCRKQFGKIFHERRGAANGNDGGDPEHAALLALQSAGTND